VLGSLGRILKNGISSRVEDGGNKRAELDLKCQGHLPWAESCVVILMVVRGGLDTRGYARRFGV